MAKKIQKGKLAVVCGGCILAVLFVVGLVWVGRGTDPQGSEGTPSSVQATLDPADAVVETAPPENMELAEDKIASFLQGPKSWKERRVWSGKWGKTIYDGSSFGAFGCGLCCMSNIYCSLTPYRCSPVDMYRYAKKTTEYGGGGAIDWGYMAQTLESLGLSCEVGNKPETYARFQDIVQQSRACLVVVSSDDSTCYWKNTPGHYVVLFLYNPETDKVFLTDSGDPDHNRHWVSLKKIYKSLKMANHRQYMTISSYEEQNDQWRHTQIGGVCVLPESWKNEK